jgi:Uri superfamily endonuclease
MCAPPDSAGSYILILRLARTAAITVGRLGTFDFPSGWYAYVGSARGPGGLGARLRRHSRPSKALHWHIDHLRAFADLVEVWYATGLQHRECTWAGSLLRLAGAETLAPRFGASDCRCRSHLIRLAAKPSATGFAGTVGESVVVAKPPFL